jgi:hypothetical protein
VNIRQARHENFLIHYLRMYLHDYVWNVCSLRRAQEAIMIFKFCTESSDIDKVDNDNEDRVHGYLCGLCNNEARPSTDGRT